MKSYTKAKVWPGLIIRKRNQQLHVHMSIHAGERLFNCGICGKDFRDISGLTIHMRTHTEELSYKCVKCGKEISDNVQT